MKDFLLKLCFTPDCLTEDDTGPVNKIPRRDSKSTLDWCLPQQQQQHVEQGQLDHFQSDHQLSAVILMQFTLGWWLIQTFLFLAKQCIVDKTFMLSRNLLHTRTPSKYLLSNYLFTSVRFRNVLYPV